MAIAPELRAQILRLYQAERWRIGTIASQLHLHRDTVQRVIAQACVMHPEQPLTPIARHRLRGRFSPTGSFAYRTRGGTVSLAINCAPRPPGKRLSALESSP